MYTIIITIIILVIFFNYSEYQNYYSDFIDYFIQTLRGLFIGGILGFIIALALPMNTEINKYEYEIEALQDSNSVNGSFFLGSGSFNGEMKYVFYYKIKNRFKLAQVDYDNTSIEYTDETPIAERYKEEADKSTINLFALDVCLKDDWVMKVPKGAIKNNYNLDAK